MKIGNLEVHNPLILGPMAGVTDWAFRTVCAELGANITVTEMVSSRALVYQDQKSRKLLRKNEGSICGAQIFGNDPQIMAEGARLALEISGCDFIDINMGCPMPKIANSGDGCGLMRTPELAGQIVTAVKAAVKVPVTVKCRLGWDKGSINVLDFTKRMEQCGADMITVHGRTRSMLYSGVADWDTIAKVKDNLSIPVIANGGVFSDADADKLLNETGADGVMVARAALFDPQIFCDLTGKARTSRLKMFEDQLKWTEQVCDERFTVVFMRKMAAFYVKGERGAAGYKERLFAAQSPDEILQITREIWKEE